MRTHPFFLLEMAAAFVALCRTMILVLREPRPVHLLPERRPGPFWSTCHSPR